MASKEALEKEAAMQAERADLRAERDHAREEKSAVEATLASSMQALAIIRAARDEEKLAVMLVRKACVSLVYPTTQADDTEHQLRLGFSGEKTAGLVADGRAMLVTEKCFLASHVEQIILLVSLGLVVSWRKRSTEMHRSKTFNEGVYLLRLQAIEVFPLHGLEDLVSTAVIDVGVVEPGREHDHIMI